MLRNYLKVALRNFWRHKVNTTINLVGLAVAIACSIVIYLFASNELSYDGFNERADELYLVYKERITPTGTHITRDTWVPLAGALREDYSGIANASRYVTDDTWLEINERRFQSMIAITDPSLFEMFTLPLVDGRSATGLFDLNGALVSRAFARKHFGDEASALGQTIRIDYTTVYTIRGILADIPRNSTIRADLFIRFESLDNYEELRDYWDGTFIYTFLQVPSPQTATDLERQFPDFVARQWRPELNNSMVMKLLPLLELYNEETGANTYAYILLLVAVVILIIAAINFMNLSTARSIERAREIGMRKVLGAYKRQLVGQFLNESLLLSLIALVIGIGMVELILPWFNRYYDMSLQMDYMGNAGNLFGLFAFAALVGLFSGLYPAFVLSRFEASESLRSRIKTGRGGLRLRSVLVVTQFALAIVLMAGTMMMWRQIEFMKNSDLKFQKEGVIVLPVRANDFEDQGAAQVRIETFKGEVLQHSDIESISSSTHVPGRWHGWFTFVYPTDRPDSERLRMRWCAVDDRYFETYGIRLVYGRDFDRTMATDAEEAVIINQAALRDLGWLSAEGKQIRLGDQVHNVAGVVEDYHYLSLASEVEPVVHRYRPAESGRHSLISIKTRSADMPATLAFIESKWRILDPARPFEYIFVDDNFERLYENDDRLATVTGLFAAVAIIIACLGLFALASLTVVQRTKEIGIRKSLGATVGNIVLLLNGTFVRLVTAAFIVAVPLAYYLLTLWLQDFAYRAPIDVTVFAIAGFSAILVAFLAVSYHSVRASLANPIVALRYE